MGDVRSELRVLTANRSWLALWWLMALSLRVSAVSAEELPVNATARSATVAKDVRSPDRAGTSGLGVGVGLGSDNAGVGGHVIYYVQLPNPKLRVAFHVGVGAGPPPPGGDVQWGVRGGSFVSFGKRHRLVLGVMGGNVSTLFFRLHSQVLDSTQVFGVGMGAGYEFLSKRGFYLRGTIGPAFGVLPKVPFRDREVELLWRGNLLTMGYKLW